MLVQAQVQDCEQDQRPGTDQGKRQNIYREQDSQQLVDSRGQSRNLVTWNVKREQTRGLVKRNSFPHWGEPSYISV